MNQNVCKKCFAGEREVKQDLTTVYGKTIPSCRADCCSSEKCLSEEKEAFQWGILFKSSCSIADFLFVLN